MTDILSKQDIINNALELHDIKLNDVQIESIMYVIENQCTDLAFQILDDKCEEIRKQL